MDRSLSHKVWSRAVADGTGCWLWTRGKTAKGYGVVYHCGKQLYAHRVAYELVKGPIPDGLELDHLCRVHACINPDHLEAVTHKVNTHRGNTGAHNARKTACKQGHPFDEANTYIRQGGGRHCRACGKATQKRYLARRKGAMV